MDEESSRPRKAPRKPGKHAQKPRRAPRPAGPAPGEAALREAALAHLARFAATEIGLKRVLQRRVDRWARRAESEGALPEVVAPRPRRPAPRRRWWRRRWSPPVRWTMPPSPPPAPAGWRAAAGRAGRSPRISAPRAWRQETAAAALPAAETELDAALAQCRRRRIGPFATDAPPEDPLAARAGG